MRRGFLVAWIVASAFGIGTSGCSGDDSSMQTDQGVRPDVLAELPGDAVRDAGDVGVRDSGGDAVFEVPGEWDVGEDARGDDSGEASTDSTPDLLDDTGQSVDDDGAENGGLDTGVDVVSFCVSFEDCSDDEVCEFSLGRCQKRGTWTDTATAVYGYHPAAATVGDNLVIDGTVLCQQAMMGCTGGRVKIGSVALSGFSVPTDENRMIVKVTAAMKGIVTVYDAAGKGVSLPTPFMQAPTGVLECDGSTPAASGVPGISPRHVGPFAAGYVDLDDELGTRVFYPAQCGSIRRPPVTDAVWPLVMIMHGNGALYMNHEHLAQLLATWGFVSVMPSTLMNMAGDPQGADDLIAQVMPLVQRVRGKDLAAEHPVLSGVLTSEDVVWVGHSRGSGRSEELIGADSDLAAHTKGGIFLGPVDDGMPVPGMLIVFGAGHDLQSGSLSYNAPYRDHDGPKWLVEIPGGNHGSFCDHKVYGYGSLGTMFGDAKPDISRHQQLEIVQTFGLPFVQRAFGGDELFSGLLDSPPSDTMYKIVHAN